MMTKEEMIAEFKLWFPELASNDAVIEIAYKLCLVLPAGIWREHYEEGFLYRMAHIVHMRSKGANGGNITDIQLQATSKTVGKLSVGYTDPSAADYSGAGEWGTTVYGRRYWYLLKYVIKPTGRVV